MTLRIYTKVSSVEPCTRLGDLLSDKPTDRTARRRSNPRAGDEGIAWWQSRPSDEGGTFSECGFGAAFPPVYSRETTDV